MFYVFFAWFYPWRMLNEDWVFCYLDIWRCYLRRYFFLVLRTLGLHFVFFEHTYFTFSKDYNSFTLFTFFDEFWFLGLIKSQLVPVEISGGMNGYPKSAEKSNFCHISFDNFSMFGALKVVCSTLKNHKIYGQNFGKYEENPSLSCLQSISLLQYQNPYPAATNIEEIYWNNGGNIIFSSRRIVFVLIASSDCCKCIFI